MSNLDKIKAGELHIKDIASPKASEIIEALILDYSNAQYVDVSRHIKGALIRHDPIKFITEFPNVSDDDFLVALRCTKGFSILHMDIKKVDNFVLNYLCNDILRKYYKESKQILNQAPLDLRFKILSHTPYYIDDLDNPTKEEMDICISKSAEHMAYRHSHVMTHEQIIDCVSKSGSSLGYFKNHQITEEIEKIALTKAPSYIQHHKILFHENKKWFAENYPKYLKYMHENSSEIQLIAVKANPEAMIDCKYINIDVLDYVLSVNIENISHVTFLNKTIKDFITEKYPSAAKKIKTLTTTQQKNLLKANIKNAEFINKFTVPAFEYFLEECDDLELLKSISENAYKFKFVRRTPNLRNYIKNNKCKNFKLNSFNKSERLVVATLFNGGGICLLTNPSHDEIMASLKISHTWIVRLSASNILTPKTQLEIYKLLGGSVVSHLANLCLELQEKIVEDENYDILVNFYKQVDDNIMIKLLKNPMTFIGILKAKLKFLKKVNSNVVNRINDVIEFLDHDDVIFFKHYLTTESLVFLKMKFGDLV